MNDKDNIVECHDYYPFGLQMPLRSLVTGERNKELFTGKELDSETGWYWFNPGRYDWPAGARWLSVDPLANKYPSLCPYAYAANNPVIYVDRDGKAIFRFGKEITAGEARRLTMNTIDNALHGGGKGPGIDFYGATLTLSDTWRLLKSGDILGAIGLKPDPQHGFDPRTVYLSEQVSISTSLGEQTLPSFVVYTQFAFTDIASIGFQVRGVNNQNQNVVSMNFEESGGNPIISLVGTLEQLNATLDQFGYQIQHTTVLTHYIIQDGKKTPVYANQYTLIKKEEEE